MIVTIALVTALSLALLGYSFELMLLYFLQILLLELYQILVTFVVALIYRIFYFHSLVHVVRRLLVLIPIFLFFFCHLNFESWFHALL